MTKRNKKINIDNKKGLREYVFTTSDDAAMGGVPDARREEGGSNIYYC
jgi:hypothetical protein